MAVTKIIPVRTSIEKSVEYICNPDKTDGSLLIYSEHCFPQTAALTFQHHLSQCRAGGNTIGRHLIQSFAPGEVDANTAHEIGKKLADEILNRDYAYVLATHVDRGHIHNHFVWGAGNISTRKRYRSNKNTYHDIRKASDRLCEESNLSVIIPHGVGKNYPDYRTEKQKQGLKSTLKTDIDTALEKADGFENFLEHMEVMGYEVKRGKHIAFRCDGQERFIRSESLGDSYTESAIKEKLAENYERLKPKAITYDDWAKITFMLNKQEAYNLIQSYGGMEIFQTLLLSCQRDADELDNALTATKEQIEKYVHLKEVVATYNRTKSVHEQYKAVKVFPERYRKKHEDDISAHENAVSALKKYKRPLPTSEQFDTWIAKFKKDLAATSKRHEEAKSKLKQFEYTRGYLYNIERMYKPQPQRTRTRTKNHDLSI